MNKKLNIVVFAYNFIHRKSSDVIKLLIESGVNISLILAADYIKISSPKSAIKISSPKPAFMAKDLSIDYKIPYYVVNHNSSESLELLKTYSINFGIIAGARILDESIINAIQYGILNIHPGLLPAIRGLDSVLWSIYKNVPLGATAHLIDKKIDAGYLVFQDKVLITVNDSIDILYEKNYQLQLNLILISLNLILKKDNFDNLALGTYNTKMSYEMQLEVLKMLPQYLRQQTIVNS